jgi:streptogramin lyase
VRLLRQLALVLLFAGLVSIGATAAAAKPRTIGVAWGTHLPELTYGTSVAVGPDGVPWFGVEDSSGPLLVGVKEDQLSLEYPRGEKREHPISTTRALGFDSEGNLWFVKRHGRDAETIVRRSVDGTLTEFSVPTGDSVDSLAIGPGGEAWFALKEEGPRQVGFIGPTETMTRISLPTGTFARSLITGPEGAIWFVDGGVGKVGRITAGGAVRLFPLGHGVYPSELAVGSDGAIWFSENGRRGRHGKQTDRIGRLTTSGKVTQFRVPFGHRTERLAADPQGPIWFSTDEEELSSISTSGAVGPHGCIHFSCRNPIVALAAGPDGALWFAIAHVYESCGGCGGGAGLMLQNEGAAVGRIAARR